MSVFPPGTCAFLQEQAAFGAPFVFSASQTAMTDAVCAVGSGPIYGGGSSTWAPVGPFPAGGGSHAVMPNPPFHPRPAPNPTPYGPFPAGGGSHAVMPHPPFHPRPAPNPTPYGPFPAGGGSHAVMPHPPFHPRPAPNPTPSHHVFPAGSGSHAVMPSHHIFPAAGSHVFPAAGSHVFPAAGSHAVMPPHHLLGGTAGGVKCGGLTCPPGMKCDAGNNCGYY
jgi:hypothetical protein